MAPMKSIKIKFSRDVFLQKIGLWESRNYIQINVNTIYNFFF